MENSQYIEFSVILRNDKNNKPLSQQFSNARSIKPLVYFSSAFGMQIMSYSSNNMIKGKLLGKLYCAFFVLATISVFIFVRPFSWIYTLRDIPLNVLTKCFGSLSTFEAMYSVLVLTFTKSNYYVQVLLLLDSLDSHFGVFQGMSKKRFLLSIILIILPIMQVSFTFWLRKFSVYNIIAHLTFFLIMLQGAIIIFFALNIFVRYLMFNYILEKKTFSNISDYKVILFKDAIINRIIKVILKNEPIYTNDKGYCWFELMQIYDRLSDCMNMFNEIYCGQLFLMFSSWLLCTLLVICRSLSPTIKFSEVIFSDLFMYTSLNIRPIFLTAICELLIEERKKTLSILMNYVVHADLDDAYLDQVQTMIDQLETRKVEVSGNVFTANAHSVLHFSGKTISYAVLMIQYFYMHMY